MPDSFDAATAAGLESDIASINSETSGTYTIDLDNSITLGSRLEAISLASGVSLVIDGESYTLDGAGIVEGLFVYQGNVTIENLTIADALAQGGNGGGGGAGLGGGLFIAGTTAGSDGAGGSVTLDDVSFLDDQAVGGNGNGFSGKGGALNGGATDGFGGGSTSGGVGGYGGGGGGSGAPGGFGGGGGAGNSGGDGGFGGGNGGSDSFDGNGGGLGAGGDIFVQQGGSLTIEGGSLAAGTVTGGSGYVDGAALGSAIFLQGDQTQTFAAAAGQTLTISGTIEDESGSTIPSGDGTGTGHGTIVIDGPGAVALDASILLPAASPSIPAFCASAPKAPPALVKSFSAPATRQPCNSPPATHPLTASPISAPATPSKSPASPTLATATPAAC